MIDEAFKAWRDSLATQENLDATSEQLFKLLKRYAHYIIWNTLHRTDPELETDIITHAFVKARTYQGTANFGTWFYRLAYNQCMNRWDRQRSRRETFLDDLLTEPRAPTSDKDSRLERLGSVRDKLTTSENQLVTWRLEGWEEPEIAAKLGVSRNQVKQLWRHTRDHIRELLITKILGH